MIDAVVAAQRDRERQQEARRRQSVDLEHRHDARRRIHNLTRTQARSLHAATPEGRLLLREVLTRPQMEAAATYRRAIESLAREVLAPQNPRNPLASYQPGTTRWHIDDLQAIVEDMANNDDPDAFLALKLNSRQALAFRAVERAERAIRALPKAFLFEARQALKLVCRDNAEPPARMLPALQAACTALALAYGLVGAKAEEKSETR